MDLLADYLDGVCVYKCVCVYVFGLGTRLAHLLVTWSWQQRLLGNDREGIALVGQQPQKGNY